MSPLVVWMWSGVQTVPKHFDSLVRGLVLLNMALHSTPRLERIVPILIKYVSEKSANEIIEEMKKRGVIRDPDKEAA